MMTLWGKLLLVDHLFKERGSSHFVTLFIQHKIDRIAEFVDSTIQVDPFTFDLHGGFIHSLGFRIDMFAFLASVEINGE